MREQPLTLALSKGRIFDETLPLLEAAGIHVSEHPEQSRKLVLPSSDPNLRLLIVRASDVPTYVEYGAADFGIVGKDVLQEYTLSHQSQLYEPVDLKIAQCHLAVAVREDFDYHAAVFRGARLRVATKYVEITRRYFASQGVQVDLVKLYGSMELAPLMGLADAIVDVVSTGNTLKANHLKVAEYVMPISSRLIVNKASLKTKTSLLMPIIRTFEETVNQK
ncbi:ATP phosphoribosyltransferase [Basilea psittacipulmonis]|uniref:ATP phosphoribosyltransferase n=1 Tax=Basilea psittacipulmonis DSM 24701 TaxID=1072685 RepID=A0A077DIN7_9BURK|nr:ATP phosphoribosyltransferase [Basilea psittacipulmonis]AIL33322.1 ATP phosphoribosyltransferase catalytic subunit [Basilea psittacipulmonis DSM 24701]